MKRMRMKKIIASFILVALLFVNTGCVELTDSGIFYISADTDVSTISDATIDKIVENIVGSMTLNEKVGQLFVVELSSLESSRKSVKAKELTKTMKKSLSYYPIGGVILYSRDIKTPKQTKRLLENLQAECDIPLFTCVDEEGGEVSRIASNSKMKAKTVSPMLSIGQTGETKNAKEAGQTIGKELNKLGFNVDFAPVADVLDRSSDTNSSATELGSRAFGSDATEVAKMVKALVKGLQSQDVMATLKHFPGQGNASMDTHLGAANISEDIAKLRAEEFKPFKSGMKAGASFVMLSQSSVESVTGDMMPACMSTLIVKDILRDELGFKGIIITDAMNMEAVRGKYTSSEAAVNCLKAGVDMILMPEDLQEAYDGVIDAVQSGDVSQGDLDVSVRRIIKTKIKKGVLPLTSDVVVRASQESYDNYRDIGEMEQDDAE